MSCLHILQINPLSVTLFANIFSHSHFVVSFCSVLGFVFFVLFMVSFAVQKLLRLIRFHLLILVFVFITLGGGSKEIFLQLDHFLGPISIRPLCVHIEICFFFSY